MATMSPEVELSIFGSRTALFERYGNYYKTRISQETHKPIPEPISEIGEALVLLYEKLNDRTERRLKLNANLPDGSIGSVIQIQIFSGGYCKNELSDSYEFPVSSELVKELQEAGILSGTPHIGYTDHSELRLNEHSTGRIIEEIHKFAKTNPSG